MLGLQIVPTTNLQQYYLDFSYGCGEIHKDYSSEKYIQSKKHCSCWVRSTVEDVWSVCVCISCTVRGDRLKSSFLFGK
jgi:hypothetical protein